MKLHKMFQEGDEEYVFFICLYMDYLVIYLVILRSVCVYVYFEHRRN